ncbi:unnamed protein product [Parajaminaea phylloscopi]
MERDAQDSEGAARSSRRSREYDYERSERSSRRTHRGEDEGREDTSDRHRSSRKDYTRDDAHHSSERSSRRRREREDDEDFGHSSHSRSTRRRRDDDEDYYGSSSRDRDYHHHHSRSSSRREPEDPYRSRRGYDDPYDPYGRGPPPPSRGYGEPYYDDYARGGRRPGGHGGGGGWREAARGPSPPRMRSPTPEGTKPISERKRKNSGWGIAAEGFEGVSALKAKSSGLFGIPGQSRTLGVPGAVIGRDAAGQAVIPEALPPLRFGSGEGAPPSMANGNAAASNGQPQVGSGMTGSNRQARRLYVGNLGHAATEASFVAFWNERMADMRFKVAEGDPCVGAQVNPEKGYAFVEFRCPEEATNAMSFDGVIFQNQALKIRRPKDYVGPDVGPPPQLHVPGVISTNVPDGPNKIYVGGLPTYLNEDQVVELLKAFGEVRAFNLVREANNGPSKGFAFCEYVDHSLTDLACQGLNDMELGDRKLVVQRASAGQRGPGGLPAQPGMTGANAGALGSRSFALPMSGEPGEPTKCMTMLNMVTPQELIDDVEYGEIVEDVRDECAKYGSVVDVRIPRPVAQSKGSSAQAWKKSVEESNDSNGAKERDGVGRVYVRFAEVTQCEEALKAIAGRSFGGRLVIAAYIKESDWPDTEDGGENAEVTAQQATGAAAPEPAVESAPDA